MNFQVDVSSSFANPPADRPAERPAPAAEITDLLRQLLEVQREQLQHARHHAATQDHQSRWRAFLSRWQDDFPGLSEACRSSMPKLERAYGQLIADLTEKLSDDDIDTDFALQDFLDRYGMRLAQFGTILNLVGPLADAGPPPQEG